MGNNYQQRMLQITDALVAQGVGRYTAAPLIYQLAWRLGLRVRPPLYQSFKTLALSIGTGFGLVWGLVTWLFFWGPEGDPLPAVLVGAVVAGTLFGLIMATVYRRKARTVHLPPIE